MADDSHVIKSSTGNREVRVQAQPDGDVWVTVFNSTGLPPHGPTDVLLSPEGARQLAQALTQEAAQHE